MPPMPWRVIDTDVWVAKDDGSDLVRAEEIVSVGIDYNGNITARTGHCEGVTVTLADAGKQGGKHPAADFHRQLIRIIAQLSDGSGAFLVRPVHDEAHGWQWVTESL
jgi:hypothetical protein